MSAIPEFIARKLIVSDSIKSTPDGFSFELFNSFAPGTIISIGLKVDGQPVSMDRIAITSEGQPERLAASVSPEEPLILSLNLRVKIEVRGTRLGKVIHFMANVKEVGEVAFSYNPGGKAGGKKNGLRIRMPAFLRPVMKVQAGVDFGSPIGKIDPFVYGQFIEHLERCIYGGIWTDDGKSMRPDTLKLIKDLKPPLMRYPGGNFASGYHWEDGIGPKEQRPKRFDAAWQAAESNQVGTDEFMQFCAEVGCEPVICVNDGSGTPEEAARWVAYCNEPATTEQGQRRAANGHPEPYGVRYWGVGNEVWGSWQIGGTNAGGYAERLHNFIHAMRAVDPTIKIVAVGDGIVNDDPENKSAQWNRMVLENAGSEIDYISWHIYQPDQASGWKEYYDPDEMHKMACAAPLDIELMTRRMAKVIHEVCPQKAPLQALDEWNIWFPPAPGAASMHRIVYTMRDALYVAGVLNVFHRCCKEMGMANLAQLVNVLPLIVTDDQKAIATALYFPFLMYTAMQTEAFPVKVTCPTFENEAAGVNITHHEGVPYIDITATRSADGKKAVLGIVNRHPEQRARLELALPGFAKAMRAQCLHAEPGVANTLESPDQLKIEAAELPSGSNGKFIATLPPCSVSVWEFEA